jgi:predicted acylesterase/phospholipase RssA
MYKTLCLSGGGSSGISIIGSLKFLEENKVFNNFSIKKYVGTSVGSIIAFLLNLNYNLDFILEFINTFNINIIFENLNIDNLFEDYGLLKGDKLINILKSFLYNKYKINNVSFKELYKITKKKICIIGSNVSKNREEYFSYETTPDLSVIKAIRISSSIPIIFTPVIMNNDYYCDGGLTNNFPINYCNKKYTLGLIVCNNGETDINCISSYLSSIYNNIIKYTNIKNKYNKKNTIFLKGIKGALNLNKEMINSMLKSSKNDTKNFFENNKKLIVYSIIQDLIDSIF